MQKTRRILCVDSSASQRAVCSGMARLKNLDFVSCSGEAEALSYLDSQDPLVAMVIGHHLADGNSLQIIEHLRLSPMYAMLPIAFLMSDRNLNLANNALRSGATEIFLRSEHESLLEFIDDCSNPPDKPVFSGTALLVEDSPSQAEYFVQLCNSLGLKVDQFSDAESAIEALQMNRYQIVIADVVLSGAKSGISLVKYIRQVQESCQPILVMSSFDDTPRKLMAMRCGADDFISKPFAPEEFVWRIRKLLHSCAQSEIEQARESQYAETSDQRKKNFSMLSPREYEICRALLSGLSDKETAASFGISFWTVRSHIQQIFTKTGALNRRELMSRYVSHSGITN